MDPQPAFTFQDLFSFIIGDMAKAVAERDDETEEQQYARSQAATHMILGFSPRDVIEAMLAGHCVMLHEVMTASVRVALGSDVDRLRRGPRSNVLALSRAFNDNLDRLERYRQRPAEGSRDVAETPTITSPDHAGPKPPATSVPQQQHPERVIQGPNRAARRQAARAETQAAAMACRAASKSKLATSSRSPPDPLQPAPPETAALAYPSPATIAACEANAEAMAALQAGDPVAFARCMGIEHPREAFSAAANTKGSPFDPHSFGPWPAAAIVPVRKD